MGVYYYISSHENTKSMVLNEDFDAIDKYIVSPIPVVGPFDEEPYVDMGKQLVQPGYEFVDGAYQIASRAVELGKESVLKHIAVGASVVDTNFKQLDSFFIGIYDPIETKFSEHCWNTFWSKNKEALQILQYKGIHVEKHERELDMITKFQQFRAKWESIAAKETDQKLVLVSDNNVFDGGLINELIKKYMPNTEPIPYSASENQEYCPFWETFSQQKGLLLSVDPTFRSDWGLSNRIFELYNVAKPGVAHDHNPANDAYTIAYDQQVLFGIRDGRITKE